MFFNFKNKEVEKNILYLSVDASSIGIALYNNKDCVYSDRRIHIQNQEIKPMETLFKDMLYAFKHNQNKKFSEIKVILEYPWVNEVPLCIKETKNKPFTVTEKFIEEIIKKEKIPKDGLNLTYDLSESIESVTLNGYLYKDPIGKITKDIQICMTKFFADEKMMHFINQNLKDFWDKTPISYMAGGQLIYQISKKLDVKNDIYITLGTTNTNIKTYSQGEIDERILISFGFQEIVQNLIKKWNKSPMEINQWIDLLVNKNLNPKDQIKIEDDIKESLLLYINNFDKIAQTKLTFAIQRPIFIVGPEYSWNLLFIYALKEKYFAHIFPHIENTKIYNLTDKISNIKGDPLIALYARHDEIV